MNKYFDTIAALATPNGVGAIGIIRVSGNNAIEITNQIFKGKDLTKVPSHTLHFGTIQYKEKLLDEVLISVFKAPNSFTKEDSIEISCHGSPFIIQEILQLLVTLGARMARPGEFTQRAFLNGRFDLAQAEAVADLIASDSESAHTLAMNQMRGGFSKKIQELREQLIQFAGLIELELDFSEEDVEFANREKLISLIQEIQNVINKLISSFQTGNAIKSGIPVAIVGKPNAGKSTLLNTLLQEEKAIVSDIAGTTRDSIEDEAIIEGLKFRFIDTAGLRETSDVIEAMGVNIAKEKMKKAQVVLYLFDISDTSLEDLEKVIEELSQLSKPYILVGNKIDNYTEEDLSKYNTHHPIWLSAKQGYNMDVLLNKFTEIALGDGFQQGDVLLSNVRHFQTLNQVASSLSKVLEGIDQQITSDFLAMDLRSAIQQLGEITGEVTNDDVLDFIFSKFCIGK